MSDFVFQDSDLSAQQAQGTLDDALKGADDGELYVERGISESLTFDDGRLKNAGSTFLSRPKKMDAASRALRARTSSAKAHPLFRACLESALRPKASRLSMTGLWRGGAVASPLMMKARRQAARRSLRTAFLRALCKTA